MSSKDIFSTWGHSPTRTPTPATKESNKFNIHQSLPENGTIASKPLPKLTCIICYSERAGGKFTQCIHEVVCLRCAQSLVTSSIEMEKAPKCPMKCCEATLSTAEDSIYSKFSTKTRILWKAFDLKSRVSLLGPTHKCQAPDCQGYIDPQSSTCQICEKKHCKSCHRVAHIGQCLGVSANIANLENIKFCKYCRSKISKEGGCPKIKCSACGRQICFECLESWSISHHGCAQYGWLMLPYNLLFDMCCNDISVNRAQEAILESPRHDINK